MLNLIALISIFISAISALVIVTPTAGEVFQAGSTVYFLVNNALGETATSVQITLSSPFNLPQIFTIPIGVSTPIVLSNDLIGNTIITAIDPDAVAATATSNIIIIPVPNPNSISNPYLNPSIRVRCNEPRRSRCRPCSTEDIETIEVEQFEN